MRDRGPLKPPTGHGVGVQVRGGRDTGMSAFHDLTLVATPCRCRRPASRIRRNRLTREAYALRPTAAPRSVARLCPMRRPQLTIGDQPARSRWAAIREPVLDATGAALLWIAMSVDLATRPLAAGQ